MERNLRSDADRRLAFLASALVLFVAGCGLVPSSQLRTAQQYSFNVQQKYQQLSGDYKQLRQRNQELARSNLDLEDELAARDQVLDSLQTRVAQGEDVSGLISEYSSSSRLPPIIQQQLSDFAKRNPDFVQTDPRTGASKFQSDVFFPEGDARLSAQAKRVLQEFAAIIQQRQAAELYLEIVGHTDQVPIASPVTQASHETNWHLSAHRAIAVARFLEGAGISPEKMGVKGYGPHQPAGQDAASNRRVEIYVLAAEAPVVGRVRARNQF